MSLQADAQGKIRGKFTIPANTPAGDKLVECDGASGKKSRCTFSGQGTEHRRAHQQDRQHEEWTSPPPPKPQSRGVDPLAQTFTLFESTQVNSVDLWFLHGATDGFTVQIRETTTGMPNSVVVAESDVLSAAIVTNGGHTRFSFPPVYLLADREYAIVAMCTDPLGELAIAEIGKFDADANRWVTSQPYTVGVMLSSSNASTWTPHQDRDLRFRINAMDYSQNERVINLGTVAVVDATDLMLMSYAELPTSETQVEYTLSIPGGDSVVVSDGERVQLAAKVTGNVGVSAKLIGTPEVSPVLYPGTQLVHGKQEESATYVSRAVPAGSNVTAKVIFDADLPSGSSVLVEYSGIDGGDTFSTVTLLTSNPMDQPWVELIYQKTAITETAIRIRLTLTGTAAARPRIRDLRIIIL